MKVIYHKCSSFALYLAIACSFPTVMSAQNIEKTKAKLSVMVNAIIKDVTFQYVDQKTGRKYSSLEKIPADTRLRPESPYTDWRYWNGVLNLAMVRLADDFHDSTYSRFVHKNIAFGFDSYKYFELKYSTVEKSSMDRWNYPFAQFFLMQELDDCGAMGGTVIEVYKTDKQKRYKEYIDKSVDHILTKQERLSDGTLVRSFPHKLTLWADDLYMGLSFLARIGEMTGESRYFDDAARQVINFHKYLFDERMGLMHHCWYSDVNRPGVAFWGRANGWAMVAQVELLDRLPKDHPQRDTLIKLLQRHIVGISQYQSGNGLWHQLLDKTDSYLETSCTAMFTYTIARAVNKGYIEPRYVSIALRGWEGVMTKILPDGQVEGVCAGTGTSDDLIHYYTRPTPLNDIHGIGAVLLAGAEVLQFNLSNPEN